MWVLSSSVVQRLVHAAGALALIASLHASADAQERRGARASTRTRNVVLIVTDGLRWQEVFRGAERALISREGGVRDTTRTLGAWWREREDERRATLLPFLWSTVARDGVLLGSRDAGSMADITNTMRFSYPGYNELFTGWFDPRIDSNDYPPNPNVTVFEWLASRPGYRGRVAAIATWDAFRRILNRERAGINVMDGWDPPFAGAMTRSPRAAVINDTYRRSTQLWHNNTFDAPMHLAAMEYVRQRKPRVLFIGYGETDEWAHSGMYDMVLQSAHRVDAAIGELWRVMQAMPEYRNRTTFVITTDHGRGDGPTRWRDHGQDVEGAQHIWMAVLGPDTPAQGMVRGGVAVTQAQVAATLAALLGEDYNEYAPKAAPPMRAAFARNPSAR